jgi:carboxypeptidase C (cathepsin A)
MKYAKTIRALTVAALAACLALPVMAAPVGPHEDKTATTHHQVVVSGGKVIKYTARAGLLPLYINDTGELMGDIFFVSYSADRPAGSPPRPLIFLWNGGPGSNAGQVHVMGFGPKRPTTAATYPEWGPNTETPMIDNPDTWLETADLVFIDPPGTGFSRATSIAYRDTLYSTRGDAEAVAEAIRVYLTRFDAWNQPLYIGGESYGTTRAMWVSEALEKRRTHLKGVILMSGGYDVEQKVPPNLGQALGLSLYTAAAHYHKRLPADLQAKSSADAVKEAVTWARTVYAPALAKRDAITPEERQAVLAGLQRYTGVDAKFVDAKSLRLSSDVFHDELLADKGLELGRYDARITVKHRPASEPWLPTGDPSLERMADLMNGTSRVFNSYIAKDLGFQSDLLYRGPFGRAFHPEPLKVDPQSGLADDWMTRMFKNSPDDAPGTPLSRAMRLNPNLRVWNIKGLYDGSCAALDEAVADSPADIKPRVTATCAVGGHMFYTDLATRQQIKRGFSEFVRTTLPLPSPQ